MPYITQYERDVVDPLIEEMGECIESWGHLNYVVTRLVLRYYMSSASLSYEGCQRVLGFFEALKDEFQTRVMRFYESIKREENTDVLEYRMLDTKLQRMAHIARIKDPLEEGD